MTVGTDERFVVISADCHAGGSMDTYGQYLEAAYQEAFADWRAAYRNPFRDLQSKGRERNWDSDQRIAELESDGQVAEVIFPNTVPPFFPTGALVARPPTNDDLELRWAGLRAHNRWLADWCAAEPERRAGIGQVFLNDVDAAIAEAIWIHEHGLRGGILIPAVPDDCDIEPLYSKAYDPLWRVCEERGIVVNSHSGSGHPDYSSFPASSMIWAIETEWFAHRPLWHMIMSGVFERFPSMRFVLSEQGCAWLVATLHQLDGLHMAAEFGRTGELKLDPEAHLPMKPSEYFQRNIWVGASFPRPKDAAAMRKLGLHKVMWGSDYPHHEGVWPMSREHLRRSFPGWTTAELDQVLNGTAVEVYGFDLDALAGRAIEVGPTAAELAVPLDGVPDGATSPAFYL
jgi:predicted TIM-barrel fold metal-dependent hydrolase